MAKVAKAAGVTGKSPRAAKPGFWAGGPFAH
jgi:hypothetical protein